MGVSRSVKDALAGSSMIRKMFEEGIQLKKQYGADKVFDFSLGNPDTDPPKEFHDVFIKLAQEDEKGSHGYMPNAGYPFVREAIAKKISREQNVTTDGSNVIMTAGAAGGLNVIFKAICNPGDEIIVPSPFFVEYRAYAANHQIKLVEIDTLDDFNPDINAIAAALNEKTAAVLINSPNNPTGKVYSACVLASLANVLTEYNQKNSRTVYLVCDEPYREIAYIDVPPFLGCYKNSIVVSSYSKNLSLSGERIGYIAVNPDINDKDDLLNGMTYCNRVLGFVNAPALMQRIVAQLTETGVDLSLYERKRDIFMKVLDAAGIEYAVPEGTFYFFCKVPQRAKGKEQAAEGKDQTIDKEFVEHLKKYLILGVPATSFGKSGWVRFAYCVSENTITASGDAFKAAMDTW